VVFEPYNFANMYNLIDKIVKRRFLWIGDGENVKSVAYVKNLVDAIIFLMEKVKEGFHIFNYADEPHLKAKEIVSLIAKYTNVSVPSIRIPLFLAKGQGRS
jgi:nucleoside-diphosphate-sugar epimerase